MATPIVTATATGFLSSRMRSRLNICHALRTGASFEKTGTGVNLAVPLAHVRREQRFAGNNVANRRDNNTDSVQFF